MFTGLIEETGSVAGLTDSGEGKILQVRGSKVLEGTQIGDSISVNGACQTVTAIKGNTFSVFASRVTLNITTLGSFKSGDVVNLERALTPSTRMGGHIVQGHVDLTGRVERISRDTRGVEIVISVEKSSMKYIVGKGSIAVDGISLTVVSVSDSNFTLYLIPETLEKTNIGGWKTGTIVNIETDILAKYVENMLRFGRTELNNNEENDKNLLSKLYEEGFA